MSKRRTPGEIIKRKAGSAFSMAAEPEFLQVPHQPQYEDEAAPCMLGCGDQDCREWANLEVVDRQGRGTGDFMYHLSECQMFDS